MKCDPRSKFSNLSNWKEEVWKKIRASTGFEPVTSTNTVALLYQLSYEATHWERGQFIGFIIFPCSEIMWNLYEIHICSAGIYKLNKLTSLPMCGFVAQLVEQCIGIHGGHGFESRWSPDFFFRLLLSNCLNWKIYCNDHPSLSSTTAVQIWIISYKLHGI